MRALDPRVEHTRTVVIQAAVELLAEEGFDRITIDGVAERSGVARSTIYRNWPDRTNLLIDCFTVACDVGDPPDTGSARGDLRTMALGLAHGLAAERWGRMIPSLVGAAEHDPDLRQALARFTHDRRADVRAVIERGIARGEVPAGDHIDTAILRFGAALYYRRLFTDDPLDEAFVDRILDATMQELTRGEHPG